MSPQLNIFILWKYKLSWTGCQAYLALVKLYVHILVLLSQSLLQSEEDEGHLNFTIFWLDILYVLILVFMNHVKTSNQKLLTRIEYLKLVLRGCLNLRLKPTKPSSSSSSLSSLYRLMPSHVKTKPQISGFIHTRKRKKYSTVLFPWNLQWGTITEVFLNIVIRL